MTTQVVRQPIVLPPPPRPLVWWARPLVVAWLYTIAITMAEIVLTYTDPRLGLVAHALLLAGTVVHVALLWERRVHRMIIPLTLAPLIRLVSLALPLTEYPRVWWYAAVSLPLFVACIMTARALGYGWRKLGFTGRGLPLQLLIACSGFVLGAVEYVILQPELSFGVGDVQQALMAALILMICTGLLEELLFRSIMQQSAQEFLGPHRALVFASVVFAVLHIGYRSWLDVAFVFIAGYLFGWFWLQTRSLLGITLAHGITNIMLFVALPWLVAVADTTPSLQDDLRLLGGPLPGPVAARPEMFCANPYLMIVPPDAEGVPAGLLSVRGTANTPGAAAYTLAVWGDGPEPLLIVTLQDRVDDDVLAVVDLSTLAPAAYDLRLAMVPLAGATRVDDCVVPLRVEERE